MATIHKTVDADSVQKYIFRNDEIGGIANAVNMLCLSLKNVTSDIGRILGEMADVLMYYNDVLLRYHVTPEEISEAYRKKHNLNMARDYEQEYKELYNG